MITVYDDQDRRNSMIATMVVHAALLVLFLYVGLKEPDPRPKEEMLVVASMADWGVSDTGSGEVETDNPGETETTTATTSQDDPLDVATDEANDVEVVKPPKPVTKPKDPKPATEKPKEQVSSGLNNAMNAWKKPNKDGEGSEGQTGTGLNEGNPNGNKDGIGTFGGDWGSLTIGGGRSPNGKPRFTNDHTEEGKVVLRFYIDRNGKVTRAEPILSESTTTSTQLFAKAKKALMEMTFSADPKAPAEQQGKVSMRFTLS